jgi:hypothetical protein
MKFIANDIVNNVLEEVKVIFLEKIDNIAYQRDYVRDNNGYIKANLKKYGFWCCCFFLLKL